MTGARWMVGAAGGLLLAALMALPSGRASPSLPSLYSPVKTGVKHQQDAAVVVGIHSYSHLNDVPYADNDARAFYDFLVYTRGVPTDRIRLLDKGASKEMMEAAAADIGGLVGPGGTAWFYYAGHGSSDPNTQDLLLVGDDARPDRETFASRTVRLSDLEGFARAGGGDVMMIIDACYTGVGRDEQELIKGERYAIPTYRPARDTSIIQWHAASPGETSGPLDGAQHGAFTYFVVGALRGWADGEISGQPDGVVELEEAALYVTKALRQQQIFSQTPVAIHQGAERYVLSRGALASEPSVFDGGGGLDGLGRSAELQRSAALAWEQLEALVKAESPEVEALLQVFIDEYSEQTVVVNGVTLPVVIPQLEDAEKALSKLSGRSTRSQQKQAVAEKEQEAADVWALTSAAAAQGGEAGQRALQAFVDRYQFATVEVDGKTIPVAIDEIKKAQKMLRRYGVETPEVDQEPERVPRDRGKGLSYGAQAGTLSGLRVEWDRGDRGALDAIGFKADIGLGLYDAYLPNFAADAVFYTDFVLSGTRLWQLETGLGFGMTGGSPGLGVTVDLQKYTNDSKLMEYGLGVVIDGDTPGVLVRVARGWVW